MAGGNREQRPQFFKVLMPGFTEELLIPPQFTQRYLMKDIRDFATILSPLHKFWHIRIRRNVQDLYFDDGWGEFSQCHDLRMGYFLVFQYEGNSVFSLKVFDLSGCLKRYNEVDNQQEGQTINRSQNEGLQNVSENHVPVKSPRVNNKNNIVDLDCDEIDKKPSQEILQNLSKKPIQRKFPQISNESFSEHLLQTKSFQVQNKNLVKDLRQQSFQIQNENLAEDLLRTKSLQVQNKNLAKGLVQQGFQIQNANLARDLIPRKSPQGLNANLAEDLKQCKSPQVQNKNVTENLMRRKSPRFQNNNAVALLCGNGQIQNHVNLSPLQLTLGSNSMEVTPGDVKQQIKIQTASLRRTTRGKPVFENIIKDWNISQKRISIPTSFCLSNGWDKKQMIMLQDVKMRSWNVQFVPNSRGGYFMKEWHEFCIANNLQVGDKCIFMLIGKGIMGVKVVKRLSKAHEVITIED